MVKMVLVAVVAAIAGGAIAYWVTGYRETTPRNIPAIVSEIPRRISNTSPEQPTPGASFRTPTHDAVAPPLSATLLQASTATASPTLIPTTMPPTEQEVVVNAFAECNDQYSGSDKEFRALAADDAVADGRQSVDQIRALVELHCDGVFPELAKIIDRAGSGTNGQRAPAESGTVATPKVPDSVAVRPTHTPASTWTPTPIPPPALRHLQEKHHMLELINSERKKAGLNPVALGDNIAAQLHAEAALDNCFSSHWGLDGLKPYMRYSLAGDYQSNGENGSGLDYCVRASDGYRANSNIMHEIQETMDGWMQSSGHRRNILDPLHKMVNIGLAWDRYNTAMYQHFEGDYATYDRIPEIKNGVLTLSGSTKNGVRFSEQRDLSIQIHYDPPPETLTRGQIARTYCYDSGLRVAALREPLTGGYFWPTHEFTTTYDPCPDPNDVAPETPAPQSPNEAHQAWQQAYAASQFTRPKTITVPWITASEWRATGATFSVKADIGDVLDRHGDGVYSLMIWANVGDDNLVISQYSIFHGIAPPNTYDPNGPH